jgi:hypothetical protein
MFSILSRASPIACPIARPTLHLAPEQSNDGPRRPGTRARRRQRLRCDHRVAGRDSKPGGLSQLIAHGPPLFWLLAGTEYEPALTEVQARIDAVANLLRDGDDEEARYVELVGTFIG